MPKISYKENPDSYLEEHRIFSIDVLNGNHDYVITVTNPKIFQGASFRFCMSGGFEFSHTKTTQALAELYKAMKEECPEECGE